MRLAYILGTYPQASETFIAREVEGLRARGHHIDIFSLFAPASGAVESVYYGWPTSFARLERKMLPGLTIRTLGRHWRQVFLDQAFDLVVAHFASLPSTVAMAACGELPLVISMHARDLYVEAEFMMEKMRRARAVVTCTMANVDLLCEQFPARAAKIHQIYHGISSDWLTPERVVNPRAPGDRLRLLAVGRFVEKKGFSVLLDACAQLRAQEFPLELTLVGDGPLRGQFLAQCARLHLGELVQFAGWLDETTLREAYAWADLFCCPSVIDAQGDRDGLPNVVLEAMAAGLPVIGSAISGIPESIADGVTGLLVPPGDPAALAMAICCCADIDVRVPMGVQAQARIRTHFAADDWLTQLEAVLQSVLREAAETRSRG